MGKKIIEYFGISRKFYSDFGFILFANAVNNGTMLIANIFIARIYGHEVFGLFSIAINVALTTFTISEFGMNLTMVRLYKLYQDNDQKSNVVLLSNLYFKLLMLVILLLVALIFSGTLSNILIKSQDKSFLILITLISGGILGFWSYFRAFLQAHDRFKMIACLTVSYALLRLILLGTFIFLSIKPNVEILFLCVHIFPLSIILLFGFFTVKKRLQFKGCSKQDLIAISNENLNYSKWVAISGISFVLIQKSMVFIVAIGGDIKQVSLLSAGLVFTAVFSLINDSILQVLFPKIAELPAEKISGYKRKLLRILPIFILLSIVLIGVISSFMVISLGNKFKDALPIFWVTGLGTALTTGFGFYTMLLHTVQKPEVSAFVNIGTLICFSIVGLLVINKFGLIGVVLTYSISLVIGEMLKAVLLEKHISNNNKVNICELFG